MPSTSGFDFSGMAAGMGATSNNSAHDIAAVTEGTSDNVAHDAIEAKLTGKMTKGDYYAYLLEQQSAREAREWEKKEADTAWQRKVRDLQAAGFSPLAALDATGQGAAIGTSQVAKASSRGSSPNIAGVIGALIAAVAMVASKGATAAASAKSAEKIARMKLAARMRRW